MSKGKAKPLENHLKDGTFRKDRHKVIGEVAPPGTSTKMIPPERPDGLPDEALKMWNTVSVSLLESGLFAACDVVLLKSLCICLHLQQRAFDDIAENGIVLDCVGAKGSTFSQKNPAVTILNEQTELIIKICSKMGLDPVSRSGLGIITKKAKDPTEGL